LQNASIADIFIDLSNDVERDAISLNTLSLAPIFQQITVAGQRQSTTDAQAPTTAQLFHQNIHLAAANITTNTNP